MYFIASSVNKPKLSLCASWNSNGITIANSTTDDLNPFSTFIDINDILYITDQTTNTIQVWFKENGTQNVTIISNFALSIGLFVTNTGDIFVDNGNSNHVSKWSVDSMHNETIMYINRGCNSLFIDINNILYCSIKNGHLVVKMSLDSAISTILTAAGTGCAGLESNMLNQPFGIYVDVNSDLYVADTGNNRIQLFHFEELNGTIVAGETASISFALNAPTSVILDKDGYLFIVDSGNHRIIRSGPDEFECIIGCSMLSCSLPNQLCNPITALFDSYGNIFITNKYKNGIQKFVVSNNPCCKF